MGLFLTFYAKGNMIIKKVKNKIIIEIPAKTERSNPYMPDVDVGKHDTLIGLVYKDKFDNENYGLARVIDMSYKDKGDQWTDIIIDCGGMGKEKFEKMCEDIEVDVVYE